MIGNLQNQCEAVRRGASHQVEETARRSMELVEQKMKRQRDELLARLSTIAAECTPVERSPGRAQPMGPDREPSASPDMDMPVMAPMPRSEIPRTVIGGPIMGGGEVDNSIGFAERLRQAEGSFGGAFAERTWHAGGGFGGPVGPGVDAAGIGRPDQMGIHACPFAPVFPGGIRPTPSDPRLFGGPQGGPQWHDISSSPGAPLWQEPTSPPRAPTEIGFASPPRAPTEFGQGERFGRPGQGPPSTAHEAPMKPSNHQHLVRCPELGKLGLSKLTTETQFKDWCIAFEMAMDDHWAGPKTS